MKKLLSSLFILLLFMANVIAQERTVTGTVKAREDGLPLPGVSVRVKGTAIGTQTGANGQFSIRVSNTAVLVFTYVGYQTQEIAVGARPTLSVTLASDAKQLGEVVVTGYGTASKMRSTISASTIQAVAINSIPLPDVNQMLQGNAPGVISSTNSGQPGSKTAVRIRGITSISASSEPLYVLDGVILTTGDLTKNTTSQDVISNLNAADIESINVLKDAVATALYGSRGANGVVVITTKTGKSGVNSINFNARYGVGSNAGKIEMMNSSQLLTYQRELMAAAGIAENTIMARRPDLLAETNTDWYDLAFRNSNTQQYNFSASGGNEKTKYYGSGEYFDQQGSLVGSGFKRYSGRLNLDQTFSKKFDMSFKVSASYTDQLNANAGNTYASPLLQAFFNQPYIPAYNADGTLTNGFTAGQPGTASYTGFSSIPSGYRPTLIGGNFLHTIERDYGKNYNLMNTYDLAAGWNILEGLRLVVKGDIQMINITEKSWRAPDSYNGRNYQGLLENSFNKNTNYVTNQLLTYNKSFSGGHSLSLLAGNEYQYNSYSWNYSSKQNFANGDLQVPAVGSQVLDLDGDESDYKFHGVFLQGNYDYKSKYFLGGSVRRDGSSRFPQDHRYGTFYSASAAWRPTEEAFMEQLGWVSDLKLRASYGTMGNATIGNPTALGNYPYSALYGFDAAYNSETAIVPRQVANPKLTWEKTNLFDVGLDFSLFSKKLYGSVEYFDKRSSALLLERPLSYTTGFSVINSNIGKLLNTGFEINVGSEAIKSKEFSWTIDLNVATLKNKVLSLTGNQNFIQAGSQRIEVGKPLGSWYMQEWAGVDSQTGSPLWYDADGNKTSVYSQAVRRYVGQALPKVTGGLTNRFTYKSFDLSFLMSFSAGNKAFNSNRRYLENDGNSTNYNYATDAADRWQKPGDISERPKAVWANSSLSNSSSSRFLEDISFLRLRNAGLGYTLPKNVLTSLKMKQLRVFVQGENLLTFTKYKGIDPDVNMFPASPTETASATVLNAGTDFFRYPTQRIVTFGVNVGF